MTVEETQLVDKPADIREGEELDLKVLKDYLISNISGLSGELTIKQFPSGFSNLTYLITLGDRQWVLRRPPFGSKVKGAHDMGREYKVLSKLNSVFPYAPRPEIFCQDQDVLGCDFYMMDYLEGMIIRHEYPSSLQLSDEQVRQQFFNWVDVLSELHNVDYEAIGLSDLGRPAGYVTRQVEGWSKRYTAALTPDDIPTFEKTIQWLHDKMPPESSKVGIIHNDYKMDNVIWSLDDPLKMIGVLDWEMATLGDPLMDLGSTLGYWVDRDDPEHFRKFVTMPTTHAGAPTRSEIVQRFSQNLNVSVEHFDFYFCFGLFRLAGIGQQIYKRYYEGLTKDPRFARLKDKVYSLHEMCEKVISESDL
ncbi:MAG: phosphotransferase family protein [Cellvibrionaceae bacterium]